MKKLDMRPTIPVILAIAMGTAAVLLVRGYIAGEKETMAKAMEPVRVVVAQQNIEANVPIQMHMIAARGIPKRYVHAKSIYPEETRLIVGRELMYPVRAGDPLLWMDFKGGEGIRSFSSMIREGERALTLRVDEASGIAGLLQPGDHIDILGTFTDPMDPQQAAHGGRGVRRTTITLLQDVVVLAVGGSVGARTGRERGRGANMLTVLVTPEEAMLLVHAQKQGDLHNILRNPGDLETVDGLPRVTFTDILQPRVREELQTARDMRVTVIRRGVESRERVE